MRKRPNREKKMRRTTIISIVIVFILLCIVAFIIYKISPTDEPAEIIQESFPIVEPDETLKLTGSADNASRKILPAIAPYFKSNNDTIGYIKIPDTLVDYPVLYSGDNEYYLTHTFENEERKRGAIFMDFRCDFESIPDQNNIILYGHRMRDGTMFKSLTEFYDKDFFYNHPIIDFNTLYEDYEWEVFTIFETYTDFYYIETDFATDKAWLDFLDKCHSLSMFETDVKFYPTDTILTLSTCTSNNNKRLVIMAKLKN